MMVRGEDFEISKEVYDRAMKNGGYITGEDEKNLFSEAMLCGYGVYGDMAYEKDGKYWCRWEHGSSCD